MVEATAVPVRAPGQIKKSGHGDRLARGEHFGRDDGGDRIGGVVKAVDVFKGDRRQDDEDEKNHTNRAGRTLGIF